MQRKIIIATNEAPSAIGTYSQAVQIGNTVYLSGQIPLLPETMELIRGGFIEQAKQAFANLAAVCRAADGGLQDLVKLNIYLTDLSYFPQVNEVMAELFEAPFPARAAVGVKQLPKNALIEVDGILVRQQG